MSLYCLAVLTHLAGTAMNLNRTLLTLSVARTVAVKALVGALAVVLLCLKELVVEVHVVPAAFRELPGGQQQLDEQLVEFLRRIEVIDVARLLRCI